MKLNSETDPLGLSVVSPSKADAQEAAELSRRRRWLEENREAIDSYNSRVERDGLTLERYRPF